MLQEELETLEATGEREKADIKVIESNFVKIKAQMQKLFGKDTLVVNNYDWFKDYKYIDFLRDVGKYVNVSYMINKDLVKKTNGYWYFLC